MVRVPRSAPIFAAAVLTASVAPQPAGAQDATAASAPSFTVLQPDATAGYPDQQIYYNVRFDKLEVKPQSGRYGYEWDAEAWVGTDYDKLFVKTEGFNNGGAARSAFGRAARWESAEFQVLYSRLISYFFDFQVGVRQTIEPISRTYAVFGVEGLAPGLFELDTQAFISQKGEVSGRLNAWYDVLLTNRLVLQPRFDVNVSAQRVPELSTGRGFTDFELSARLRYEFTREFAPYVGVSWERKVGETAAIAKREGEVRSRVYLLGGLRLLF
ncbi:copper resistance protein B [Methylorubrum populi]|uniref:Copper resistance protein B n=1 Tax=Methylorubrum rhodesianum TaxID=29427 RepID=A0ABU9Z5E5_9HYPH|nr:copper resistance protein B [Methylorubrum rhodesianum]MBK3404970.1 copper resistance protein B [Methylorubrum rhodesianum]MBY0144019.1 copper resistance protein B [Methylorubrum populi]